MNNNVIYGLIDPITKELRYIGKTNNIAIRVSNHISMARRNNYKSHKNNWIRKLLTNNQMPEIIILESYDNYEDLNQAEIDLISYYKYIGCDLTNGTEGGDGGKCTEDIKLKISESRKKFFQTEKGIKERNNIANRMSEPERIKQFINNTKDKNKTSLGKESPQKIQFTDIEISDMVNMTRQNISLKQIATKYNCSVGPIVNVLKNLGIKKHRRNKITEDHRHNLIGSHGIQFSDMQIENIKSMYNTGNTLTNIAYKYNCSTDPIRRILGDMIIKNIRLEDLPIEEIKMKQINGVSQAKLADEYNCSTTLIRKVLGLNKIKHSNRVKTSDLPSDEIKEKYKNGKSIVELTKEYNCSPTPIRKILGIYGK